MELKKKIILWIVEIREKLEGQVWYQELKARWEELDPEVRKYVKMGSLGFAGFVGLVLLYSTLSGVYSLRNDYFKKSQLLQLMNSARDEMEQLKTITGSATAATTNWQELVKSQATGAGIDEANVQVSAEKKGDSSPRVEESRMDVKLNNVNVKQLVRFAYQLENGNRALKIRHLLVEAPGPEGYLNATLALSGFAVKSSEN